MIKKIIILSFMIMAIIASYYGMQIYRQNQLAHNVINVNNESEFRQLLTNPKQASVLFLNIDDCHFCKNEIMKSRFFSIADNPKFKKINFYMIENTQWNAKAIMQQILNQEIHGHPFFLFLNKTGYIDKKAGIIEQKDFENILKNLFNSLFKAENQADQDVAIQDTCGVEGCQCQCCGLVCGPCCECGSSDGCSCNACPCTGDGCFCSGYNGDCTSGNCYWGICQACIPPLSEIMCYDSGQCCMNDGYAGVCTDGYCQCLGVNAECSQSTTLGCCPGLTCQYGSCQNLSLEN